MPRIAGIAGRHAAICCAMLAGTTSPVLARDGTPTTDRLTVDITATLVERCGLGAGSNPASAEGRIDRSETLVFSFALDCNTPFRIGVNSANGAMRMTGAPANNDRRAEDGFAVEKSYRVALSVDTDDGLLDGGTCRSRDLTSNEGDCPFYGDRPGRGLSSREATAINRTGTLTVRWDAEDQEEGARHAAGLFQDTLTVVVGPRI